jgi:hypothetical protein
MGKWDEFRVNREKAILAYYKLRKAIETDRAMTRLFWKRMVIKRCF